MWVLNIAGMAIIFALVRSTTSTASGQRWAAKPYENPGGYARPATRLNVHAPRIHKRSVLHPSTRFFPPNHENGEFFLIGDHPGHHHQPRPVITQKPGPISETPLMSSEADTEEHIMPLVMTEDHAMMPGKELTNFESNEAMIEEVSEHDEMISIREFKEVLHELVEEAVNKIVMKNIKTAKQNLIGLDEEAIARDPQLIGLLAAALVPTLIPAIVGGVEGAVTGVAKAVRPPSHHHPSNFNTFGVALMDAPPPSG